MTISSLVSFHLVSLGVNLSVFLKRLPLVNEHELLEMLTVVAGDFKALRRFNREIDISNEAEKVFRKVSTSLGDNPTSSELKLSNPGSLQSFMVSLLKFTDGYSNYPDICDCVSYVLASLAPLTVLCGLETEAKFDVSIDRPCRIRNVNKDQDLPMPINHSTFTFNLTAGDYYKSGLGADIWPAARYLAHVLLHYPDELHLKLGKKTVLELGSGVGLGGLAAIVAGASRVVFTDGEMGLCDLCEVNAKVLPSSCNVSSTVFDWNEIQDFNQSSFFNSGASVLEKCRLTDTPPGLILIGADIVYELAHADMVINVLRWFLTVGPCTVAVISVMCKEIRRGVPRFRGLLEDWRSEGTVSVEIYNMTCDKLLDGHLFIIRKL